MKQFDTGDIEKRREAESEIGLFFGPSGSGILPTEPGGMDAPQIPSQRSGVQFDLRTQSTATEIENDKLFAEISKFLIKTDVVDTPRINEEAERIIRIHYVEQLCEDLVHIIEKIGQPKAAVYVDSFFSISRAMRDVCPFDPYIEIVMALNDAMAFKNRWAVYTANQYELVRGLLKKFANQPVNSELAMRAVMELEDIGFDTTPFETEPSDEPEEPQS